jgi:hypothetical protein
MKKHLETATRVSKEVDPRIKIIFDLFWSLMADSFELATHLNWEGDIFWSGL